MIFETEILQEHLFDGFVSSKKYLKHHSLDKVLAFDINSVGCVESINIFDPLFSVNPKNKLPFPVDLSDLTKLHHLIISRKVMTILEFGVGKSTIVFNDALSKNQKNLDSNYIRKNLRRKNLFECHSVDNSLKFIKKIKSKNKFLHSRFHFTNVEMGTFNGRVCTYYNKLPNVCPDFIYLDGPDQFSTKGSIRGISTNHQDRLPMSADILTFEHFLLPGTLLVVDGRTANARFLKTNLQRNWLYFHDTKKDQHYFELCESALGIYNKRQIAFCLGENYNYRLKTINKQQA